MVLGDCLGVCCNTRSVLQAGKDMGGRDCIAIQFLYCNLVGLKLYCNTLLCIVTGSGAKVRLYRDTAERCAQQGAVTRRRALRHGMAGHATRALGARPGRAAGLCTWCIQPVFDLV